MGAVAKVGMLHLVHDLFILVERGWLVVGCVGAGGCLVRRVRVSASGWDDGDVGWGGGAGCLERLGEPFQHYPMIWECFLCNLDGMRVSFSCNSQDCWRSSCFFCAPFFVSIFSFSFCFCLFPLSFSLLVGYLGRASAAKWSEAAAVPFSFLPSLVWLDGWPHGWLDG